MCEDFRLATVADLWACWAGPTGEAHVRRLLGSSVAREATLHCCLVSRLGGLGTRRLATAQITSSAFLNIVRYKQ